MEQDRAVRQLRKKRATEAALRVESASRSIPSAVPGFARRSCCVAPPRCRPRSSSIRSRGFVAASRHRARRAIARSSSAYSPSRRVAYFTIRCESSVDTILRDRGLGARRLALEALGQSCACRCIFSPRPRMRTARSADGSAGSSAAGLPLSGMLLRQVDNMRKQLLAAAQRLADSDSAHASASRPAPAIPC